MNHSRLSEPLGDPRQVALLLREAAARITEAYALLRQSGPQNEAQRWDDGAAWQLESLQTAIDTCLVWEQRLTRAALNQE